MSHPPSRFGIAEIAICVGVFGLCLYSYIEKQNALTQLKMRLPQLEKELEQIREENQRLSYAVEQFENPSHLIELAHRPEFGHLKHPLLREVLTVFDTYAVAQAPHDHPEYE